MKVEKMQLNEEDGRKLLDALAGLAEKTVEKGKHPDVDFKLAIAAAIARSNGNVDGMLVMEELAFHIYGIAGSLSAAEGDGEEARAVATARGKERAKKALDLMTKSNEACEKKKEAEKGEDRSITSCASGETCGSSLKGEIVSSYEKLVKLFGEPIDITDGYKVSTEWILKTNIGGKECIFTIYDYKATVLYDPAYMTVEEFRKLPHYDWHVGSREEGENVVTFFKRLSDFIIELENKEKS